VGVRAFVTPVTFAVVVEYAVGVRGEDYLWLVLLLWSRWEDVVSEEAGVSVASTVVLEILAWCVKFGPRWDRIVGETAFVTKCAFACVVVYTVISHGGKYLCLLLLLWVRCVRKYAVGAVAIAGAVVVADGVEFLLLG
jgi:hypothetical protein